jgi:hypothetical protein
LAGGERAFIFHKRPLRCFFKNILFFCSLVNMNTAQKIQNSLPSLFPRSLPFYVDLRRGYRHRYTRGDPFSASGVHSLPA